MAWKFFNSSGQVIGINPSRGWNFYSSTGEVRSTGGGGGSTLTVEEVDGAPSIANVTTLRFDQADGFTVSSPGAGIAKIDLTVTPPAAVDGGDHLHGIARWVANGSSATFELPDVAEYIESVSDDGIDVDDFIYSLSADRTQLVLDAAPLAGNVIQSEYVIARL